MKKLLFVFVLLANNYFVDAQSQNLQGTYQSEGYFFKPNTPIDFSIQTTITKISTNTYEAFLGNLAGSNYTFQFTVNATNHLVNWVATNSTPASPASGFMTADNPGGFTYPAPVLPGTFPYIQSGYNNIYDPVTKTFYMHYGYGTGAANQNGFSRQFYTKYSLLSPPKITSFSPATGTLGTVVTIKGHHLSKVYEASFHNQISDTFYAVSDSVIKVVAGGGASGKIYLENDYGRDSTGFFTYLQPTINPGQWQYVGSPGLGNAGPYAIAISKNNIPYIVYRDSVTGKAVVQKFMGGAWLTVGSNVSAGKVGFLKIAIDDNGVPYVCFNDSSFTGNITVRKFNGTSWVNVGLPKFAQVYSIGQVFEPQMAIDGNNIPYVAVAQNFPIGYLHLSVYKFNGASWDNISSDANNFFEFAFTVDKVNNVPYILFDDQAYTKQATVSKYVGGSWYNVGLADFTNAPIGVYYLAIKVDKTGTPVVAMQDNDGFERLSVFKFANGMWNLIGSERFSQCHSFFTSLALDKNNYPVVAFRDNFSPNNGGLIVMNFSGSGNWRKVGNRNFAMSDQLLSETLAIDTNNIPYVAFNDLNYGGKLSVKRFYTSLLPLDFISFTATKLEHSVQLNWQTANEVNTAWFNVQRRVNGSNFTNIGKVNATGSGEGKYHFTDELSTLGTGTIYYRLQIIDKDGKSKYSDVRSIKLQNNARYTISPNPAKDYIAISGKNIADITITDATGKQVMTTKVPRINISGLARGIYFVRIQSDDDNIQTEKLVVE